MPGPSYIPVIVLLSAASGAACGKVTLDDPTTPVDAQVIGADATPVENDARGAPDARPVADARPATDAPEGPADAPPDPGTLCVDGDLQERDPVTGACFMLFRTTPLSWEDAHDACEALNPPAHLATVTSAEEHAFTVALVGTTNAWLGAHDLVDRGAQEGAFEWVTGEPWAFDAFADGEPNNGGSSGSDEDCMLLVVTDDTRPQSWDDRVCSSTRAYLCERD